MGAQIRNEAKREARRKRERDRRFGQPHFGHQPSLPASISHIAIPDRMAARPRDRRGFPVPFFAALIDGEYDFRVIAPGAMARAWNYARCWLCGQPLGRYRTLVTGPMCLVNRTTAEPGCHRDCAVYAVQACPFLSRPKMVRNAKDLPEEHTKIPGGLERNPGATVLFTYDHNESRPTPIRVGPGWLFRFPHVRPIELEVWTQGRQATQAEVQDALTAGLPVIHDQAKAEGPEAEAELALLYHHALILLGLAEPLHNVRAKINYPIATT